MGWRDTTWWMHQGIVDDGRGDWGGRVRGDKGQLGGRLLELLRDNGIRGCQIRLAALRSVKLIDAQFAAPRSLGWGGQSGRQAVHVIPTIAVVAEEQLIVIVRSATNRAIFTLDALPSVALNRDHHVGGELEAGGMPRPTAVTARDQLLWSSGLFVLDFGAQTEIAVRRRCYFALLLAMSRVCELLSGVTTRPRLGVHLMGRTWTVRRSRRSLKVE